MNKPRELSQQGDKRSEPEKDREVQRLNKVIEVLMNRAEHASSLQGSAFNLFQTAIVLEEEVQRRTEQLEVALQDNKKMTRALQQAKDQMDAEMSQRMQAQKELELVNLKLAALNITDQLTNLVNRRGLDELLYAEWLRAISSGRRLGIGMVDIDNFKLYNDSYGHLAGDECLRRVAEALQQSLRQEDLVARYGGEEFTMVLPGANITVAMQVAERARSVVEALAIPHTSVAPGVVTVSIGVASEAPGPGKTAKKLLDTADKALYRAKSEGRNCVRASG
ncbi:diguanylate cyclase [uncultured Porticoccus sp.]|uniref:diguanylate cyclase n=1 Tax=uncultured Porticoccus sp. TaxID=1256050 RepID=UPI00261E000E|nr:diguanylate cyclase [uncultured Porticoccus sp.]